MDAEAVLDRARHEALVVGLDEVRSNRRSARRCSAAAVAVLLFVAGFYVREAVAIGHPIHAAFPVVVHGLGVLALWWEWRFTDRKRAREEASLLQRLCEGF